jgi:DNA polymerase-3 subunit alpha
MKKFQEYLKKNKIKFVVLSESTVRIDDKTYELVFPNNEGKLFDDAFEMTCDDTVEDNYAFSFGGNYYWTPKGTETKPVLNPLKYIGVADYLSQSIPFLGIHGKMEILNGNRDYVDWCKKSIFLNVNCLGIIEKNTLAGTIQFQMACTANSIKPIIGATYTVFRPEEDYRYDIKLFVKNEIGWESLLLINKEVNVINNKFVDEERLLELLEGLFVIADPKLLDYNRLNDNIRSKIDYFQLDSVEYEDNERDRWYLLNLKKYAESDIEPVLIQDAYYLDQDESEIKTKLNQISGVREYKSHNQYFKCVDDMFDEIDLLFNIEDDRFQFIFNESIKNLNILCDNCDFQIELNKFHLPDYILTDEQKLRFKDKEDLFWSLIDEGLGQKIKSKDVQKYKDRVELEYSVIIQGERLIDYFLILWDIIDWCDKNKILVGVGRGSSGGSLIAYLLNITNIDPFEYDLLFERFLNENRVKKSLPDIDSDFEGLRRDEVKSYMEQRFGKDHVCSVGTYGNLKLKMAFNDLSRLQSVPISEMKIMTSILDDGEKSGTDWNEIFYLCSTSDKLKSFVKKYPDIINDSRLCLMQPRSSSIHACATIIVPDSKDIFRWFPVKKEKNRNGDEILVSEWEGLQLDKAGFLKEDILGILQLDKIANMIKLVKERKGIDIDFRNIPLDDRKTYEYFGKGWNEDVFQFGTRGLKQYTKDLKPESIEELSAANALYRPGAMKSNAHNDFIDIKFGRKDVEYDYMLEEVTKNTYGLYLYQEQTMLAAKILGGFSLIEADMMRKVMLGRGKKQQADQFYIYENRFIEGSIKNGCSKSEARSIWNKLEAFAGYGFNKSHAVAYAITGYISQWFKVNYPIEFWVTAFKFSDDKKVANYISEIYRSGDIKIATPEINKSSSEFTVDYDTNTIYWSITSVKQAGEISQQQIEEDKKLNGHYFSFEEFLSRHVRKGSKVTKQIIENLVLSGVFDEIEEIKQPKDRIRLIDFYRKEYKIKIDKEKDQFTTNEDSIDTNWWWSLQQKKICGFSLFEFDLLCETYLAESVPYYDAISIDEEKEKKEVTTGGYLNELVVRNGKKGEYAELTLDNNFEFVTVKMWQDEWKKVKPMLDGKEKILVLLSGTVDYDNWKKKNVLYMNKDSSICVLE